MSDFLKHAFGPVVGAGASLVGGFMDYFGAQAQGHKQRRFAREMATRSENFSREMYQRQLEDQQAWNNPTAQMQRLQDAGLNPYLGQAMLDGNSINVPSAGSPSYSTAPIGENALGAASQGMQNMALSVSEIFRRNAETQRTQVGSTIDSYRFNREVDNDNLRDPSGRLAYYADGQMKLETLRLSTEEANIKAVQAARDKIRLTWEQTPVMDNGVQLVDDAGNPRTNATETMDADLNIQRKNINKLGEEITKIVQETTNLKALKEKLDVDKLIAKYQLDNILPAQLSQINAAIDKLFSDIAVNYKQMEVMGSQIGLNVSLAGYNNSLLETENALRRGRVLGLWHDNNLKSWDSRFKGAEFERMKGQAAGEAWFADTWVGKGMNYGISPFLRGLGSPLLGAAAGYAGGKLTAPPKAKPIQGFGSSAPKTSRGKKFLRKIIFKK